ncbi:hypothetical protein [Hymenobacter metallicola]|uniref:hypothetical protein n=1 Tax=Hymenobacter metallicola TaxID=2563114 RepID=UPI0014369B59|nr:hypothetical protein [Hymenobacter metallicola]
MTLHYLTDAILEVPDFLSPAECPLLIARSEQRGFAKAGVGLATGAEVIKANRVSLPLT